MLIVLSASAVVSWASSSFGQVGFSQFDALSILVLSPSDGVLNFEMISLLLVGAHIQILIQRNGIGWCHNADTRVAPFLWISRCGRRLLKTRRLLQTVPEMLRNDRERTLI